MALLNWVKNIFDWLGRADFLVAHPKDPG